MQSSFATPVVRWLPHHVKTNYIKNSQNDVARKCSDQSKKDEALSKLNHRFKKNGFTNREIATKSSNKTKISNNDFVPCKINFISDACNRKLNKLIKQCDLPIKLISKPAPTLQSVVKNKQENNKHSDCRLCALLPNNFACSNRFLVYRFKCNLCNDFYIGQTNRPFYKRYNEHRRDLDNKNKRNALYEHGLKNHDICDINMSNFDLDIIDRSKSAIDCRLTEARLIKTLRPPINRKYELPQF